MRSSSWWVWGSSVDEKQTMNRLLLAIVLVGELPAAGGAQSQNNGDARATPLVDERSGAYRVGSGDVLEVDVYDDPDLSGLVTVQHGGEVSFPLLGEVFVDGLTTREIQARLTELLAKDFLVDPQVVVRVKEHRSQWVTLVGEVARPGKYYLQGTKTLLELLTEAGGFTQNASGEVIVSRGSAESPFPATSPDNGSGGGGGGGDGIHVLRFFLTPDQSAAEQKESLSHVLENGDIVTAGATQSFYISGEVKSPGSYPLTPGLTVLKAVSMAGGLSRFGSKGKVEVLRRVADGGSERIRVDLDEIESGKKADLPLRAEDIIKVGKRVF